MVDNKGLSLIEALLAIGIVGGVIICLLGLFTPVLSKVRVMEFIEGFEEVEEHVNAFIRMGSFDEIYVTCKAKNVIYFYEGVNGKLEMSKSLSGIQSRRVIKASLLPSLMTKNPESYFAIEVELCAVGDEERVRRYTVIKNR